MRVINILGSPRRKGTSSRIAESFTAEMEKQGAEVDHFYLNGMSYKGCQGCEKCHTKQDSCILKDDLSAVLDTMRTADVAVFSSPVYYSDISGQFKMFFDRTWSHVEVNYENENPFSSRLPAGKTALFILTQGDVESKHGDIIERYSTFLQMYGYDLKVVRAASLLSGSPDEDVSAAQQQVVKIAQDLMKAGGMMEPAE